MKRLAITVAAIALASSASAGSDRYNDLRLDTSKPSVASTSAAPATPTPAFVISTKSEKPAYAYTNPFGVGPNNDSR